MARWIAAAVCAAMVVAAAPSQAQEIEALKGQLRPERHRFMAPEAVVGLIAPKPGSTIVDLGAGYGLFTFPLAKAMGDTGKVFATDRDPRAIRYIEERIRADGIRNLSAVQVRTDVVDPFYKDHLFDVIFVADVLPFLPDPQTFLSQLRPQLREQSGRLWVLDLRLDADFTAAEFADPEALRNALAARGPDWPFLARFGAEVRQIVASGGDAGALPAKVAAAANGMLQDPSLFAHALADSWPLNYRERGVRQTLDRMAQAEEGSPAAMAARRLLNRLVLQDLLKTTVWERAFSLDTLDWRQWTPLFNHLAAIQRIGQIFADAGYVVVKEHTILPYHRVVELARGR